MAKNDIFGDTDPRKMPSHFFPRARHIDYSTAIRADTEQQDFSVCPRHWYIDVDLKCEGCRKEFTWTAKEQESWFEDWRFWVDSFPRHCPECRQARRHLRDLRREYDALVSMARNQGSNEQKRRVIEIVSALEGALTEIPSKMRETKDVFQRQISREESNI